MRLSKRILILLVVIILAVSVISLSGCKKPNTDLTDVNNDWSLEVAPGEEVLATRVQTLDVNLINEALADETKMADAVIHIFGVAQANANAAPYYATFSDGRGSAVTGPVGGKMTVRSFNINKNGNSYGRSTGFITEGIPATALVAAKALLEFTDRSYYDKATNTRYKQKTSNKAANAGFDEKGFPGGSFYTDAKKTVSKKWSCNDAAQLALFKEQERLREIGEKFNHRLAAEAIENLSIEHNEAGYYTVKFSFKTDENTANNYTNLGRDSLRESASSKDLAYVKLDYVMDIWDSGYFRNFNSIEQWEATISIGIKIHGTSDSKNEQKYTWKEDDCDIEDYDDFINEFTFTEAVAE